MFCGDFRVTLWTKATLGLVPLNDHAKGPALRHGPCTAAIPAQRTAFQNMDSTVPAQRTEPTEMDDTYVHESETSGNPAKMKKKRPLEPHEGEDDANPTDLWSVWHSRRKLRDETNSQRGPHLQ